MKNTKLILVIDTIIKIVVIIALVVAAAIKQEYSYFTFLRWLVMASFIYFAYKSYENKQFGLLIFYITIAVIFNPFLKFWFQKQTWHLIDYLVAIIILAIIIFNWTQKPANKQVNNSSFASLINSLKINKIS